MDLLRPAEIDRKRRGAWYVAAGGDSWSIVCCLIVAVLVLGTGQLIGQDRDAHAESYSVHEIKAGFIYKFASFVTWPEKNVPKDKLVIGILGKTPVKDAFDDIGGSKVGGRIVEIEHLKRGADTEQLKSCQILFISSFEERKLEDILLSLAKSPTLTVGDSKGFVDKGGMIGFVEKKNGQIGLEINDTSVTAAGLEIRSMLKRIAVRVVGSEGTAQGTF